MAVAMVTGVGALARPCRRRVARLPFLSGWSVVGAAVAVAAGWLLTAGGLVGVVAFLPGLGWAQMVALVLFCGAPQAAFFAMRRLGESRRIQGVVTRSLLDQRVHGSLDPVLDSERRPLRPIGTTMGAVAARTGLLLGQLLERPGVRIFHGVRSPGCVLPRVTHAVVAGRDLVLVESVAWPPGRYDADADGRIRCDGRRTGQSVGELAAAVRCWRRALPGGHRVSGLVVVHPSGAGGLNLPAGAEIAWTDADGALALIGSRIGSRHAMSRPMFAALLDATARP